MWLIGFLNFFYDIFFFTEDNIQAKLVTDLNLLIDSLANENRMDIPDIPDLNLEWLSETLQIHSKISILNREDWNCLSENLIDVFDKSLPEIIKSNYSFLEKQETLIIEQYHSLIEEKVKDVLDFNNYCTGANLINILELIENTNLSLNKKTINTDFLRYIGKTEYNQSSEFFKDHLIRSLSLNEKDVNNPDPNEMRKFKKYIFRKSIIEGFLNKKKLI